MYQIYAAYCESSGKVYVGQTCQGVEARWRGHRSAAKCGENSYFYNAVRKYGTKAFLLQQLAEVPTLEEANNLEKLWIICLRAAERDFGYNGNYGGDTAKLTEDTKRKIGLSKIGRKFPKLSEAKKGAGHHLFGKRLSEEHRQRIGDANRGEKNWSFGKARTEEHRKNLAAALRGRTAWNKGVPSRIDVVASEVGRLYQTGMSTRELVKYFSLSRNSIKKRLKEVGIETRKRAVI